MLTKETLAANLDGMEYPFDLPKDLREKVKAAGLVVVYGTSDDIMEFDGAFRGEFGCYGGGTALIDCDGLLSEWADANDTPEDAAEWIRRKAAAWAIKAVFSDGDYTFTYRTDIPHSEFEVVEGDDKYCLGIIFSLADLVTKQAAA